MKTQNSIYCIKLNRNEVCFDLYIEIANESCFNLFCRMFLDKEYFSMEGC